VDLDQHPLCQAHLALLERFRGVMNLVGPGPVRFHLEDCAQALQGLDAPSGRWVDLGSGAGFPGLVFAARFPEVALELVDSRRKRCVFLEQVLAAGLPARHAPVHVQCTRIEDLPPGAWDGAMARALAAPEQVLAWAERVLVPAGRLFLMLTAEQPFEVPRGWRLEREHAYAIDGKARRAVLLQRD